MGTGSGDKFCSVLLGEGGPAGMAFTNNFDFTILLFLNRFVGKSRSLDELVQLLSDAFLFNGVLLVAILWLFWFKDSEKRPESVCLLEVLQPFWQGF